MTMTHYYVTDATPEVLTYLCRGMREFYTRKDSRAQNLSVCFLASEEYVAKMKARPFFKGIKINIKA